MNTWRSKGICITIDKNNWIANGAAYGCDYSWCVKSCYELVEYERKLLKNFDYCVIHFDDFYPDFLMKMVEEGYNIKEVQVRIHGVSKETFIEFKKFVDKYWTNQEGWRPWGVPKEWLEEK